MKDPNCPKFLESHVQKLKEAWEDTNEKAQTRKKELTGNFKLNKWKPHFRDSAFYIKYLVGFYALKTCIADNLTSWETFHEQTKECHTQLDLADKELASIKKVFDLERNISVYETHKKTGAAFRTNIEGLFNMVNDANNCVQSKYF